jgi:hypothetical protein
MPSLEHITVGSKLFVPIRFGRIGRIVTVDRVTATQIIAGPEKFRRDNGKLVGSTGWETTFCREATEEDFLQKRINDAEFRLQKLKITPQTLEAAEALINASNKE